VFGEVEAGFGRIGKEPRWEKGKQDEASMFPRGGKNCIQDLLEEDGFQEKVSGRKKGTIPLQKKTFS